jgi:hypothetical protein
MLKKALVCTMFLGSVCTLPAWADDDRDTLFKFDGGIGSQPFRNTANVAVPNLVAGVTPGGAPWVIKSLKVEITTRGRIKATGKGLLLGGGDTTGSRGGPRQVVASLFCRNAPVAPAVTGTLQTVPYNSEFVDLDADGNFKIDSLIANASTASPTLDCGDNIDNRPVLLIRTVTAAAPGSWFAAGILKSSWDDKERDGKD